jgi:hypothetical protein
MRTTEYLPPQAVSESPYLPEKAIVRSLGVLCMEMTALPPGRSHDGMGEEADDLADAEDTAQHQHHLLERDTSTVLEDAMLPYEQTGHRLFAATDVGLYAAPSHMVCTHIMMMIIIIIIVVVVAIIMDAPRRNR